MKQVDFNETTKNLGQLILILLLLAGVGFATTIATTVWFTLFFRSPWS